MPKHVDLRFYAGLRSFLSTDRASGQVTRSFDVAGSVKDVIEACGVPHVEVAFIVANGAPVDFAYRIGDGDAISVYPPFTELAIDPAVSVSPEPLAESRFVLDGHLGRLARYLRLLGFDTVYDQSWTDPELVAVSTGEGRILLTRDVGLLMHATLTHGYFVRAIHPEAQLAEVGHRFDLVRSVDAFTRCMRCNGRLRSVAKAEIADRLPPATHRSYDEFQTCVGCGRVYWEGAHHARLQAIVDRFAGL